MNPRDAKIWLNEAWKINSEFDALEEAKKSAVDKACKITASLSGMPGSPSKDPHKFENAAILVAEIDECFERLNKIKQTRLNKIKQVENSRHRAILIYRHIDFKPWNDIAAKMGYLPPLESNGVFILYRKALEDIAQIL